MESRTGSLRYQAPVVVPLLYVSGSGIGDAVFDELLHCATDTVCAAAGALILAVVAKRRHQLGVRISTMRARPFYGMIPVLALSI
jgi:hypothetical protein